MWNIKDIAKFTNKNFNKNIKISGILIDSRKIKKNNIFIAIKGNISDGNHHINNAIKNGGLICISDNKNYLIKRNKNIVLVRNSYMFLYQIAKLRRKQLSAKVVGITGSSGKSSTKEFLKFILKHFNVTFSSQKNYNNNLGITLSLANTPINSIYCIYELGMNSINEIKYLSRLINPQISIITNVFEVHSKFFSSFSQITKNKAKIIEGMVKNGLCIIKNSHYERNIILLAKKKNFRIFTFGKKSDCFFIKQNNSLIECELISLFNKKILIRFQEKFPEHMRCNFLAVIICLNLIKINITIAKHSFQNIASIIGRGKIIKIKNVTIVDESYNSNPNSLQTSIEHINKIKKTYNRLIAIIGDMNDLNNKTIDTHRNIKTYGINKLFCVGQLSCFLYQNVNKKIRGFYCKKSQEINKIIIGYIKTNDLILIKGSKFIQMEFITEKLKNL